MLLRHLVASLTACFSLEWSALCVEKRQLPRAWEVLCARKPAHSCQSLLAMTKATADILLAVQCLAALLLICNATSLTDEDRHVVSFRPLHALTYEPCLEAGIDGHMAAVKASLSTCLLKPRILLLTVSALCWLHCRQLRMLMQGAGMKWP